LHQFSILLGFAGLENLNMTANPVCEEVGAAIKKEILMILPKLKCFNKEPVEEEEVTDALNELKERKIEEQRRIEEEIEAKKLADEEEERRIAEELEAKRVAEEEERKRLEEEAIDTKRI